MPGEQHVFLAFFARVADQGKSQPVIGSPAKFVHAGTLAAFGSFTARLLDCNRIASDSDLPKCGVCGFTTSNVPSAFIVQAVPRELVHVPANAAGPERGAVAHALIKTSETPARIVRKED